MSELFIINTIFGVIYYLMILNEIEELPKYEEKRLKRYLSMFLLGGLLLVLPLSFIFLAIISSRKEGNHGI